MELTLEYLKSRDELKPIPPLGNLGPREFALKEYPDAKISTIDSPGFTDGTVAAYPSIGALNFPKFYTVDKLDAFIAQVEIFYQTLTQ